MLEENDEVAINDMEDEPTMITVRARLLRKRDRAAKTITEIDKALEILNRNPEFEEFAAIVDRY